MTGPERRPEDEQPSRPGADGDLPDQASPDEEAPEARVPDAGATDGEGDGDGAARAAGGDAAGERPTQGRPRNLFDTAPATAADLPAEWRPAEPARAEAAPPDVVDEAPPEVDLTPPSGVVMPEPVRASGAITRGAIADAAKLVVLGRIKAALADVPTAERPHNVRVTRAYRTSDDSPRSDLVERLVDRLDDYGAAVHRVTLDRLPRAILDACRARGVRRLVVPADLPAEWRPGYAEVLVDDAHAPLDLATVDGADGVVTACALAIAETGTIVLDGGDWQGRRAITLVPDYHLCVVHADQIVGSVPEAVAALVDAADRPLTLVSGPSATSDIELSRVQGVHGPRTLEVMLIG